MFGYIIFFPLPFVGPKDIKLFDSFVYLFLFKSLVIASYLPIDEPLIIHASSSEALKSIGEMITFSSNLLTS
jgi:hypothetical protein